MDVIMIGCGNELAAEAARAEILKIKNGEAIINPQDAIVVVKTPQSNIKMKHPFEYFPDGTLLGSWFGMLVGFLLGIPFGPLGPLVGTAIGTALGALTGALTDIIALDEFKEEIKEIVQPGTAALFILTKSENTDKVVKKLQQLSPDSKIITTTIEQDVQQKLQNALKSK